MNNENRADNNFLYTLIPLDGFKALMGIDDREDKQARFCLTTATLNIEQYCKRKFLRKQHFDSFKWTGDLIVYLKEYPVTEILSVYTYNSVQWTLANGQILEPEFYRPMIGNDYNEEIPFELLVSASLKPYKLAAVKVIYWAGYVTEKGEKNNEQLTMNNDERYMGEDDICERLQKREDRLTVPADLAAACMKLAAWNFNRYRGKRIGMSGNIRGSGVQGEHFEMSMPINVRKLLEPYKRRVI